MKVGDEGAPMSTELLIMTAYGSWADEMDEMPITCKSQIPLHALD
jgi:hypothetical protein